MGMWGCGDVGMWECRIEINGVGKSKKFGWAACGGDQRISKLRVTKPPCSEITKAGSFEITKAGSFEIIKAESFEIIKAGSFEI